MQNYMGQILASFYKHLDHCLQCSMKEFVKSLNVIIRASIRWWNPLSIGAVLYSQVVILCFYVCFIFMVLPASACSFVDSHALLLFINHAKLVSSVVMQGCVYNLWC